jgi:hypothetical protein
MANIEYFENEVKTGQDAVQDRTATSAKIQPASCVRAGHGIPMHLGRGVRIELLTSPKEDSYWVMKATLEPLDLTKPDEQLLEQVNQIPGSTHHDHGYR